MTEIAFAHMLADLRARWANRAPLTGDRHQITALEVHFAPYQRWEIAEESGALEKTEVPGPWYHIEGIFRPVLGHTNRERMTTYVATVRPEGPGPITLAAMQRLEWPVGQVLRYDILA